MDHVMIRDLEVMARVGVPEEERARPQLLVIGIDAEMDLSAAASSDELDDTLDYGRLAVEVADLVRGREVRLLETLAEHIADLTLRNERVERVTVEVAKASPPIDEDLRDVAVRIERGRS